MGFLSGLLGAAGGYLTGGWGGALSSAASFLASEDTNKANANLSQEQMRFQKLMSDTAHQREVRDLKKAGLNPMLTGKYSGASTPPGSMAVMQNSAESADRASTNYMTRKLVDAQIKKEESQALLNSAQAAKAVEETRSTAATANTTEFNLERERYIKEWFKSWDLAGSRMADETDLVYLAKNLKLEEQDVVHELKAIAKRMGFHTFGAAVENQKFRSAAQEYMLRSLDTNEARAYSDFYGSAAGRMAPYISTAESGTRALSNIGLRVPRGFKWKGK